MGRLSFRGWATTEKKMYTDIFWDDLEVFWRNPDTDQNECIGDIEKGHVAQYVIRLQSTGLIDNNGEEIFEGDIVRFSPHYFGDSFEPECIEAIIWDDKECSYPWKLIHTGFQDGPDWCEVIGNIFQHPNLL